jgi:hypothetical protein
LRAWLKTNPQLSGLIEAQISTPANQSISNDDLNTTNTFNRTINLTHIPQLITFSKIPQEGFFDIICQVCGILESKDILILLLWDGTKTKYK